MIKIFKLFFFISLGVLIGYLIHIDPGYMLLDYNHYSVETSMWFGLTFLLILFIIGHYLLRFLQLTFNINKKIANRRSLTKLKKHRNSLDSGLKYLAQGQWQKAENQFISGAKYHTDPTSNYIGALKVAQAQGVENIDDVLPKNNTHTGNANIEILLTKAKLFTLTKQWSKAEDILLECIKQEPKHSYAIRLLSTTYKNLNNWQAIAELLPSIKKTKALTQAELLKLKQYIASCKLDSAQENPAELQKLWTEQAKEIRNSPTVIAHYCNLLCKHHMHDVAQLIIEKRLKKSWESSLLVSYGNIAKEKSIEPLMLAEKWLSKHPDDSNLFLCLGTLSMKNEMLPKAEQYFKRALRINQTKETLLKLATICEQNNKPLEAINYLKQHINFIKNSADI